MSLAISETLRIWSQKLDKDFFDEDMSEVQVGGGDSSRTVTNRTVTVRGQREGRPLVAIFSEYLVGFRSGAIEARNVLDLFMADKSLTFDGLLRPRNFLDKLLGVIGLRKGERPNDHALFSEYFLKKGDGEDLSDFDNEAYCEALYKLVTALSFHKLEWHGDSGINVYVLASSMTEDNLEKLCNFLERVLATRQG